MNALLCQSVDTRQLALSEVDVPTPGPDEVLIRVKFCGVNFPDTLITRGKYQFQPELPFAPGQEVYGEVISTGAQVDHVHPEEMVLASMTWGGFAEFAIAKGVNTYRMPPGARPESAAALLETYATAYHALQDRAEIKPGETLVVLGASGGTGTAAVQLGRVLGCKVIAVASTEAKRQFALENGADDALGYDNLKAQLKAMGGCDVIFDPIGGVSSEQAFRAIKPGGRHLIIGFASGNVPAIPWNLPLLKSASIVGVFWGSFWRNQPDDNRRNVLQLLNWLEAGRIDVKVSHVMPLKDGEKALEAIEKREVQGKLVLSV
ncbi:NADPH:quinone reductase-like Zn-dependent oxidoreductase [Marinoscillum furvescens DSM 4134]|uniref:NADPH:quinone reductase-like Zn-dependent oxidoreductase n=2 Tax=Marinoscillum furvescens TaxID=1026 RepID=A0A3D9KXG8_MARFU|nr:NADPH:quinone reductase-like Zn-dependent oxidoreductase [Marinoscillum furvescens DSM 4134]